MNVKVPVDTAMLEAGRLEITKCAAENVSVDYVLIRVFQAMLAAAPAQGDPADPQLWCKGYTVPAAVELPEAVAITWIRETESHSNGRISRTREWRLNQPLADEAVTLYSQKTVDALRTAAEALRARLVEVEDQRNTASENCERESRLKIAAQSRTADLEHQLADERKRREAAEALAARHLAALTLLRKLPAPVEPTNKVSHDRRIWEQWQTTIIVCQTEIDAAKGTP